MKTDFLTIPLFILFVLTGCINHSEKCSDLKTENQRLTEEIQSLRDQLAFRENIKLFPVFYPRQDSVPVGKRFEAALFVGMYNETDLPLVTVYNRNSPEIRDTLKYDKKIKGNIFSYTPSRKGHYIFFADMKIPLNNDTTSFKIKWEFYAY